MKSRMVLFLAAWGLAAAACAAAAALVIEDVSYARDSEAQAAWKPMAATAPVAIQDFPDGRALRLPCQFARGRPERASWDRSLAVDLSACRSIEFDLLCRDAEPVSYFSLYLKSGNGWYHGTFYPESARDWNVVTLDRASFGTEGQPAGWERIDGIRLSAWRGQDRDTEFFLRNLKPAGVLGQDAFVAIIRGESVAQRRPSEARTVSQSAETAAQLLRSAGLDSAVLSDSGLTDAQLAAARVVILPYNPEIPDRAADLLSRYARRGGRLVVCYSTPEPLRSVLPVRFGPHVRQAREGAFATIRARAEEWAGAPSLTGQRSWNIQQVEPVAGSSRVLADWLDDRGQPSGYAAVVGSTQAVVMTHILLPDDPERKARLLLAMVGHLDPDLWGRAVRARLDRVGAIGPAKDLEEAGAAIGRRAAPGSPAAQALARAQAHHGRAKAALDRGEYSAAMDEAQAARESVVEAWCRAQSSEPGEFRAFWCHSAFGVEGLTWDDALRRLAENGFTAIIPNMLWGGVAYYESQVLPVAPVVAARGDQIAACLEAARRHGIQVHVWKVNWNLGREAPASFRDAMLRAGRLQASLSGQEESWLCPSHPENQKLEIESMLEVARQYPVDGIHFDYIRYPDGNHCFCDGCRERFQRAVGKTLLGWPSEVSDGGSQRAAWLEWRRSHITAVVRAVAERARALRPGIRISAAVFRNWPSDRDSVGQDWKLWCDRGWLDFVCPMDYTSSHRQFETMLARQVEWAGPIPCYPGIGESASSSRLGPDGVIEQIQIARRYSTRGFVIFNYGVSEARELLPRLGLGITARNVTR